MCYLADEATQAPRLGLQKLLVQGVPWVLLYTFLLLALNTALTDEEDLQFLEFFAGEARVTRNLQRRFLGVPFELKYCDLMDWNSPVCLKVARVTSNVLLKFGQVGRTAFAMGVWPFARSWRMGLGAAASPEAQAASCCGGVGASVLHVGVDQQGDQQTLLPEHPRRPGLLDPAEPCKRSTLYTLVAA